MQLGDQHLVLRLRPRSIRAPGFEVLVQNGNGQWREHPAPPVTTITGDVLGHPDSFVSGSLSNGQLRAVIRLAGPTAPAPAGGPPPSASSLTWVVQPLLSAGGPNSAPATGASISQHAVFRGADVSVPDGICATDTSMQFSTQASGPGTAQGSSDVVCEIACDADVEFYELNGSSVPDTVADIESIISASDVIYTEQFGIHYQITTVRIRTVAAAPYTSTNHSTLLSQFRNDWNTFEVGTPRDIAHLFTGKNIDGSVIGVAYLGVICSTSFGYGLSQSRFSGNFASRVALTAHEVGHNWSSGHCNGDADCGIMCSGLGGCSGVLDEFGLAAATSINQRLSTANCLSPLPGAGPPSITTLSPSFGSADGGDTIILSGSSFGSSLQTTVRFGGVPAQVVSVNDDTIVLTTPPGIAGMLVGIEVSGPTGDALLSDGFSFEWSIVPGDTAIGTLSQGDVDRAFFQAAAGSKLIARVTRKPFNSSPLIPGVRLIDPLGNEIALDEDAFVSPTGKVKLNSGPLALSGTYRLEAYGLYGTAGGFKLRTKLKHVGKVKSTDAIGPSSPTASMGFEALAGSEIFKLKVVALAPSGAFEFVEGLPSALLPEIVSIQGPDGLLDLSSVQVIATSSSKLILKHIPLEQFGAYQPVEKVPAAELIWHL